MSYEVLSKLPMAQLLGIELLRDEEPIGWQSMVPGPHNEDVHRFEYGGALLLKVDEIAMLGFQCWSWKLSLSESARTTTVRLQRNQR